MSYHDISLSRFIFLFMHQLSFTQLSSYLLPYLSGISSFFCYRGLNVELSSVTSCDLSSLEVSNNHAAWITTSVLDSIFSHGLLPLVLLRLRHWTCGSFCMRTLMSCSPTKSHQSAFTTFSLTQGRTSCVWRLVPHSESPYGLGVLMLSRKALNNMLMFTFSSLYRSGLQGLNVYLCVLV